jgi:alpha-D-ribose 1-methylphosphonate 5-triphosphate synthase subunit PhnH
VSIRTLVEPLPSTPPPSYGINAGYLARLEALLETDSKRQAVTVREGRGLVFERIVLDGIKRRALIAPVSIPGAETQVKMTKAELDDLTRKANATTPASEDAALDHLKAENLALDREAVALRGKLEDAARKIADLERQIADLQSAQAAPRHTPEKSTTTIVRWTPTAQGKQLKASGLTVDDLRQTGFRWVPADQAWESLDPSAQALVDRILAAPCAA